MKIAVRMLGGKGRSVYETRHSVAGDQKMKIAMTMALAAILAFGAWTSPASAAWLQKTGNTKEYQQDLKELKRQKRNWTRALRDVSNTKKTEIVWGKEKKGGKRRIIVLNPPLKKTIGSGRVEVEWFHSPIDELGTSFVWIPTFDLVKSWKRSLEKRGIPVVVHARLVGSGPEMTERFDEQRRRIQELILAWDGTIWEKGTARDVYRAMIKRSSDLVKLQATRDAAGILGEAGVDREEWTRRANRDETGKRIKEVNRRYDELVTRGAKINPKAGRAPQDPILLIDGKYLLMGSVVGKARDLFRIGNRIIRNQLDRRTR